MADVALRHTGDDPRRGRGLPLIHLLSHHAEITPTEQGTVITMAWQLTRDHSSS
ncbi:hypothetical protein QRX50_36730 [Amycolatopsis carbonis]|uniref:Uncharacterized protein n=1 Tax=Amycolatopsis carbonis TaxID=715471 RepID=A0A9Y2MTJ7_9PSEU|nr:hypothetical protein [Amycolatopsis sp. 2-15]WIX76928.1 hypothetical protein QRX50_36730 [Amycolatopsis sp. 2-15]